MTSFFLAFQIDIRKTCFIDKSKWREVVGYFKVVLGKEKYCLLAISSTCHSRSRKNFIKTESALTAKWGSGTASF